MYIFDQPKDQTLLNFSDQTRTGVVYPWDEILKIKNEGL